MKRPILALHAAAAALLVAGAPRSSAGDFFEESPIRYSDTEPDNAVSALDRALDAGTVAFTGGSSKECLQQVLDHFGVPAESQVLVFSKTSKQNDLISPATPRSIFFSESCYIGWVPGGQIEIACYEANLGPVFYLFDPRPTRNGERPVIRRDQSCLSCHTRNNARDVPGVMVRSVYPDALGHPLLGAGTFLTTHESPLEERWGGWYVTGHHGAARHMGNVTAEETAFGAEIDREAGANLTDLREQFDVSNYLRPTSDIVALMVLEHQTAVHNVLTAASFRTRQAIHRHREILKALGEPECDELSGSALSVANSQAEKVVRHLLFCDEAPLPEGGIEGDTAFIDAFRRNRRPDPDGDSLKDFQLLTRLFKNRCSYMIHSPAFDALPDPVREIVYRRLWEVLSGEDDSEVFAHLGASERSRIVDILRATREGLPEYWTATDPAVTRADASVR